MEDKFKIDSQKLEFHPHRVAQWLEGKDDWEKAKHIYPIYVEVSPSGGCNHACSFCGIDYVLEWGKQQPKIPMIDGALLRERLAEMSSLGVKSVMMAGEGEPLLHREINAITLSASEHMDVAFTTNGVLLDQLECLDMCTWIKISVNAGKPETYAKVHHTKVKDWDRVWINIHKAVQRKGNCTIGVQMVCLPENAGEEAALQQMCDDAGVDYCVFKPYSQHKMSITKQYEGYKPINLPKSGKVVVREEAIRTEAHGYEKCNSTPFFWSYIQANGDVYSCSAYLLDERFRLGNINGETFLSIWQGERRKANWELVTRNLDIAGCRVNCRMDKANRYLWGFDHQQHINFV